MFARDGDPSGNRRTSEMKQEWRKWLLVALVTALVTGAAGKDLIGQGYKILAGSTSSGVALQMAPLADQNNVLFISGAAASDEITGVNRHTFRAGRQSYQDVQTAASFIAPKSVGKKIVVFAEDTAFGASNVA